ncbi:VacJ family lipoprotein [Paraburkholderia sp.]|uniref:MlaA family lipoprotein n=1 Tax=Paraburkholderia sp. TaxID=1926495 RepID=UPI00238A42DD|nr:VacJ family lipoprotein [Paraburkholderia sp.]MDE1180258.1 VacJ family lipoprotein [Paraburkholderia sp.]
MIKRTAALALVTASLVSGCASGPDRKPGDPLEPMNRTIFKFNDAVDRTIAVPVAKGYQKVTPQPLRTAISNFFSNLGDLGNAANNLLQLNITDATEDLMRFAMNSTFGIGGLLDFATPAGLPKHHQDFGLTMGRWGVPAGPYLVLPLFGPSSVRDGLGRVVDVRFNALNYIEPAWRNPLYVLQFVSVRSDLLGATDLLQAAALDPYSFVRDAYTQQRKSLLRGKSGGTNAPLPDYGDPGADGDNAPSGATGASGAAAAGVPDYSDPGDAAAAPAPAGAGAGAAAAGGTAAATTAPATAAPASSAQGTKAAPAPDASAPAAQ